MLKSSAELLRSYVDIVDEAIRMAFTQPGPDGQTIAVRPGAEGERDRLAMHAKMDSREYNRQMKAYATQPTDVPGADDMDPATATARARGLQSGNIMRTDKSGKEVPSGPSARPWMAVGSDNSWVARAVDTNDPSIKWRGRVSARDGKPGALKKPEPPN